MSRARDTIRTVDRGHVAKYRTRNDIWTRVDNSTDERVIPLSDAYSILSPQTVLVLSAVRFLLQETDMPSDMFAMSYSQCCHSGLVFG